MTQGVNLGSIFASITLDASGLLGGVQLTKREMASLTRDISKQAADIGKIGRAWTMGITAPIIGAGAAAIKFGIDFDRGMRNVNSISKLSESAFKNISSEVKALAMEVGKVPADLANGLYDIASSGFQGAEGMQVLRESARGAKAGLSETNVAAKALTGVLNAYGLQASDSSHVMDVMFKTVDRGVITFEQLAQSLGAVLSTAASSGIAFEEVGAAVATLTKAGNPAEETITALNNAIIQIISPSKEARKMAGEMGLGWLAAGKGAQELRRVGLSGVMQEIGKATGYSIEKIGMLMPEIRSLKGVLGLVRQEGSAFAEDLDAMSKASGATSAALAEQNKSLSAQWEKAWAKMQVAGINFFEAIMPILSSIASAVGSLAKWLAGLDGPTRTVIIAFAALAAGIGPALWGISALATAITTLSAVSIASLATPLGWLVGILAVVAGATYGVVKAVQYLSRTTADEADEASKAARKHAEDVRVKAEQAEKTRDLVREYEELRKKTNRTNEETGRMKTLLSQIRDLSPDLIKGYDSQGRAIGLLAGAYTTAAEEARKAAVAFQQAGIAAQTSELVKVKTEKERVQSELKEARRTASKGTKQVTRRVPTPASAAFGSTSGLPGGPNPLNMPGSNIFDVERQVEEPVTSKEQAAASRRAEQLQGQLKDIEKREKQILETRKGIARGTLPGLPGMNAPGTGKAGSGGTGGGGGGSAKSAPALPFNLSLEQARNNVAKIELEMKGLEDAFRRAIEAGDEKKSTERIGKLREGIAKLKQSYIDLRNAESVDASRTMKHDSAAAKTAQEKRDAANKAVAAIQKADIDQSANIQELRNRDRAAHDALLALRKKGSEEEQRTADRTAAKMREEVESEFDIRGEAMEEERRIAEQNANTLREFDRRGREIERENTERRKRDELEFLDWEREHNLISSQAYIATLEVKLAAERQYSEEWFDIHAKIEAARADEAGSLVSDAEQLAETNKTAAVDLLSYWLEVYQGMGTAGVAAAEKVEAALVKLTTTGKQQAKGWYDGYKAVIDSIRVSFVDAVAGMIQHTRSFRDFMKDVWNQILRYAVNALVQMVIESAKANKQAGGSGVKGALSGIGSLLGGPVGAGFAVGTALMKFFNFDNPINDTGAVRSGADFGRLFKTGMNTTFNPDALVRNMGGAEMKPANTQTVVNNSPSFNVSVNIDKIDSDMDVNRMADNIAYLVNSKLALVPVR